MESPARDIARRLGDDAEAVCRHYLSNGRREGGYWVVGDLGNSRGRSLYVRLSGGSDGGRAGKWTDAATGEHGDLLDIIAASGGHARFRDTLAEARRFLAMPPASTQDRQSPARKAPSGSPAAARRLWSASKAVTGTPVAAYLEARSLRIPFGPSLRFHPRCFYRPSEDEGELPPDFPAMIAAVTDEDTVVHGVHRTWLDRTAAAKAPVACPRRAMGQLLGHGVRFGKSGRVMAAGEGIETMLSLREVAPALPLIAGLSSAHLAAIRFPEALRRLYVACDRDAAGRAALAALAERAGLVGLEILPIEPRLDDLNSDLVRFGHDAFRAHMAAQFAAEDASRFLMRA